MSRAGSLTWFAHHELRLAWREWLAMMTAGRRRRRRNVAIGLAVFAVFMHLLAFSMLAPYAEIAGEPELSALIVISGSAVLSWALMLSQAMEQVTRLFYARADLDLILSSPVAAQRVFAVRIAALALSVSLMALLLAAPFINVLALWGGARWLAAYGVVLAMGMVAASLAVALTTVLFRTIGPKRTRLIAQIVAAVIGAGFVIGLQIAAILTTGSLSRIVFLQSSALLAAAPEPSSLLWWPARAMLGDATALVTLLGASFLMLGAAIIGFAPGFGEHAIAASGVAQVRSHRRRHGCFRPTSPAGALRRKEWTLLRRDPWLVSQSLMQVLYLVPPALLLWRSFSEGSGALALLVPVLVMAAGQLGGGLAWLTLSGEDAPDLVASAPVSPGRLLRAKVEAVMGGVALVFAPFLFALAIAAPFYALVAAGGVAVSSAAATAIQLWFRSQTKRSHFRRRQISSRIATFAEAFSSITWAGTGALAAAGTWLALVTGTIALLILAGARLISPARA